MPQAPTSRRAHRQRWRWARLARRHRVSVLAGSIPELGAIELPYNAATVIDGHGRLRAKHRKRHLFAVDVPGRIYFRTGVQRRPDVYRLGPT